MWDNGKKNIKLDQATFADMDSLSRDSAFNAAWRVKKVSNNLIGWLAETWAKKLPMISKLEMPEFLWFNVEEGIQRLREIGLWAWTYNFRSIQPYWEGQEDIPFTTAIRNKFVRGALESLKSSVITLLCKPDFTVGTTVTVTRNLNAMGVTGFQGSMANGSTQLSRVRWAWLPLWTAESKPQSE